MVNSDHYGFSLGFEAALAALLCCRPRLFSHLGILLNPEGIALPGARLLLKAAQAVARDCNGRGPEQFLEVIQRLCRWREEGAVMQAQINEAVDVYGDAVDDGLPSDVFVLSEVLPVLRRRATGEAIREVIDVHGKKRDVTKVVEKLQRANRLGESAHDSGGVVLGVGSFAAIAQLKKLVRLELGVPEIDGLLDGGLWRKGLGTIIADTGAGKSMYLSHQASSATAAGLFVGYATLELPEAIVLARMKANLTNVPINTILNGSDEAKARMAEIEQTLGLCVVKSFSPRATTVGDLLDWVKEREDEHGRAMDLLSVDYADKLSAGEKVSGYEAGEIIYEGLRLYAFENDKWVWTASQSKGRDKKKKKLDTSDVADSVHKVRAADIVLTATLEDDQLSFYSAKNRLGQAGRGVGPLPHEFEYGRVAPIAGSFQEEFDDAW